MRALARLIVVLLACASAASGRAETYDPWAVYYGDALTANAFFDYRLVVFDADRHPPVSPLARRGIVVLGYISAGEIESHRADFAEARRHGYVLAENPAWPGSFTVDVRDPRWQDRVERIARRIVEHGFQGFFLDTLDDAAELERAEPGKNEGMIQAAAGLIKWLRARFPSALIMLNRGFELHRFVAADVDFILAESIRTDASSDRKTFRHTPDREYRDYVLRLDAARRLNPRLVVMTLDYWAPDDEEGIKRIYAEQRAHGFLPYVATPELDRVIAEPR
jgi:uncharacterized protein (TIGR01370 family)